MDVVLVGDMDYHARLLVDNIRLKHVKTPSINHGTLTLISMIMTIRMCCLGKGRLLYASHTKTFQ